MPLFFMPPLPWFSFSFFFFFFFFRVFAFDYWYARAYFAVTSCCRQPLRCRHALMPFLPLFSPMLPPLFAIIFCWCRRRVTIFIITLHYFIIALPPLLMMRCFAIRWYWCCCWLFSQITPWWGAQLFMPDSAAADCWCFITPRWCFSLCCYYALFLPPWCWPILMSLPPSLADYRLLILLLFMPSLQPLRWYWYFADTLRCHRHVKAQPLRHTPLICYAPLPLYFDIAFFFFHAILLLDIRYDYRWYHFRHWDADAIIYATYYWWHALFRHCQLLFRAITLFDTRYYAAATPMPFSLRWCRITLTPDITPAHWLRRRLRHICRYAAASMILFHHWLLRFFHFHEDYRRHVSLMLFAITLADMRYARYFRWYARRLRQPPLRHCRWLLLTLSFSFDTISLPYYAVTPPLSLRFRWISAIFIRRGYFHFRRRFRYFGWHFHTMPPHIDDYAACWWYADAAFFAMPRWYYFRYIIITMLRYFRYLSIIFRRCHFAAISLALAFRHWYDTCRIIFADTVDYFIDYYSPPLRWYFFASLLPPSHFIADDAMILRYAFIFIFAFRFFFRLRWLRYASLDYFHFLYASFAAFTLLRHYFSLAISPLRRYADIMLPPLLPPLIFSPRYHTARHSHGRHRFAMTLLKILRRYEMPLPLLGYVIAAFASAAIADARWHAAAAELLTLLCLRWCCHRNAVTSTSLPPALLRLFFLLLSFIFREILRHCWLYVYYADDIRHAFITMSLRLIHYAEMILRYFTLLFYLFTPLRHMPPLRLLSSLIYAQRRREWEAETAR